MINDAKKTSFGTETAESPIDARLHRLSMSCIHCVRAGSAQLEIAYSRRAQYIRTGRVVPGGSCVSWRIAEGLLSRCDAAHGSSNSCTGLFVSQCCLDRIRYVLRQGALGVCFESQGLLKFRDKSLILSVAGHTIGQLRALVVANVVFIELLVTEREKKPATAV